MNSINQYNQMIDSLTERGYYKRKNFAIGGGVIQGENLGTREGFSGPQLIKTGNNKGKYYVRYRDEKFGKTEGAKGFKEGNTLPMTKEEAEKFYNNRKAQMSKQKF